MSERNPDPVLLRILRRDGPDAPARFEEFAVPRQPRMNVIACLMAIERDPTTRAGAATTPVAYQANCLEEVCGSCTMLINGRPRQACSTLVDDLAEPIELGPLRKFPVVRDLIVDRRAMFETLMRIRAWIPLDGTHDLGPGPVVPEKDRMFSYRLSRCMTCGCCMEGCPQFNPRSKFMGPAPLAQVHLFNNHPTGAMIAHERLGQLLAPGGIADCGNTQNCVKLCPKDVPLTEAIGRLGWQTTKELFRRLFGH
jgi:succinate dehydrogenase / fumarate reductase, iron-sulfur subunit